MASKDESINSLHSRTCPQRANLCRMQPCSCSSYRLQSRKPGIGNHCPGSVGYSFSAWSGVPSPGLFRPESRHRCVGAQDPGLDPIRGVQVSTQHHFQHAAHPPFQPQPRCHSSTSSFCNAAGHAAPPYVPRLRQNTLALTLQNT